MPESLTSSKQIESFALSLADIQAVDLDKLHVLSLSVRWPHRAEDWAFLRQIGHGVAALDDIGRVLATAMWFPQGERFATIGMVITSPRLQTLGAGQWLMQHVLRRLEGRNLGLNATRAAERLYLSLGFAPTMAVHQHQGEARSQLIPGPLPGEALRDLGTEDLAQIVACDRLAAGHDRSALLAALMPRSRVHGLFRNGALVAFAFDRAFGRGTLIGPVVASSDQDAIAVVAPPLTSSAGSFVRLDTRQASGPFVTFLTASGLPLFDTVTSMSLGPAWTTAGPPSLYGLAMQATG